VANEPEVKAMVDCAVATYGRLDCLVNNAGGPPPRSGTGEGDPTSRGSIATLDMEEYDAAMGVLLRGVVLGMKHAAVVILRRGSGSIINIASVAGSRTGYGGLADSAAKAVVIHLSRCVAMELGEKGIRVNSISPGGILTGIFGKAFGLPGEVADWTSDVSSFVNGHDLVVDGGLSAGLSFSESNSLFAELSNILDFAAAQPGR
jgi:NAD(P)-dependent dehydrogenase (short-subunit alcohol dehydrogenase family)